MSSHTHTLTHTHTHTNRGTHIKYAHAQTYRHTQTHAHSHTYTDAHRDSHKQTHRHTHTNGDTIVIRTHTDTHTFSQFWDQDLALTMSFVHRVVIAEIDASLNDIPYDAKYFPTILLYPKSEKSNPIEYSEPDRSAAALAVFISRNATSFKSSLLYSTHPSKAKGF